MMANALVMLLPLAVFLAWRKLRPAAELSPKLILALVLVVVLGMGAVLWFGMENRMTRDEAYVPATLAPDGSITPGHGEQRR